MKMLRRYFNCNEILEIVLTYFCNILYYVGNSVEYQLFTKNHSQNTKKKKKRVTEKLFEMYKKTS